MLSGIYNNVGIVLFNYSNYMPRVALPLHDIPQGNSTFWLKLFRNRYMRYVFLNCTLHFSINGWIMEILQLQDLPFLKPFSSIVNKNTVIAFILLFMIHSSSLYAEFNKLKPL